MNNKKGGLADSPFFQMQQTEQTQSPSLRKQKKQKAVTTSRSKSRKVKSGDTTIPRHHDTKHETVIPRYHDTMIETVRKAVKEFGKEAATHRFTMEEKKALADLIYTYKQQGTKTSENEIARIAINFLISDYHENGENSILHRVLEALNT